MPLLAKVKDCYLIWIKVHSTLPKTLRHSLGQKIDTLFVETIEAVSIAWFLQPKEKQPYIHLAIRKWDTLKVLLRILWEAKGIDDKKYIAIATPTEEIGKMLGGWNGQVSKQNSPT